jgi:hypothetical protein
MDEANGHKALMNTQNEIIHELRAKNEQQTKEVE